MSCDGFDHGTRVKAIEELIHLDHSIPQGAVGVVEAIDHSRHQIDVRFEKFGLIKGLPAHSFGPMNEAAASH